MVSSLHYGFFKIEPRNAYTLSPYIAKDIPRIIRERFRTFRLWGLGCRGLGFWGLGFRI